MWNNVINAWWPLVLYPATDAPRFHKGMIAMICVSVATLGCTWLVWYLERREHRMKARTKAMEGLHDTHAKSESETGTRTKGPTAPTPNTEEDGPKDPRKDEFLLDG
ncbi:hypothetical protein D9758_001190 [Tetrapyrgos nigripes]|uniref:Uncharacterized protein n=1 Tax=Tetrapyrgos nigripes TaxID=182062 RepID=A0A8H5GRM9_9AGAR|nr:hypothetical protein D9758_001190 [Tetrapyrgos nigripes]